MSDPAVPPNDAPTPTAEVPAGVPADAPPAAEAPGPAATPGMSPAACGARLAELFPALFGTEGPPKPIKLRIHVDLQARAPGVFSRRVLGPFFARYTTSNAYLKVLSTATERFDLDGQPAGEVTEEHRSAALAELARRREIAIAKRAAERGATRPPARPPARPPTEGGPGDRAEPPNGDARRPAPGPRRAERRPERPPRGAVSGPGPGQGRPPRPQRPERSDRRPEPRAAQRPDRPAEAPEPQDPAQRERALLLRQFESSPLTKANFCVLRRIAEAELDAQLVLARQERDARRRG